MLLQTEKDIRGGTCRDIYLCAKTNNKYMREYDKNKESSYLNYCNVNNLYGWKMSQKFLLGVFKWVGNAS